MCCCGLVRRVGSIQLPDRLQPKNVVRSCLWSGPRNISTALMYSFAQCDECPSDCVLATETAMLHTHRITCQGKTYRGDAACVITPRRGK